jgi:hypothetical protein
VRILYIARHEPHGNDNEGAISHALTVLGHDVIRVKERNSSLAIHHKGVDLVLFHKLCSIGVLRYFEGRCKRAFWYFDRVESHEQELKARSLSRTSWMSSILPHVDAAFCTDGDWAKEHNLHWLPQGFDERLKAHEPTLANGRILFLGQHKQAGEERREFVDWLTSNFSNVDVVEQGLYREKLATVIGQYAIVVGPDAPVSDRYWSNRVYMALGLRSRFTHAYSVGLAMEFAPSVELLFYRSRAELKHQIWAALTHTRNDVCENGYLAVRGAFLYRHRMQQLLEKL